MNTFLLRVKISIHGGKHQDVILSPLTSKEAFLLISVEPEFLLTSPAAIAGEHFLLSKQDNNFSCKMDLHSLCLSSPNAFSSLKRLKPGLYPAKLKKKKL